MPFKFFDITDSLIEPKRRTVFLHRTRWTFGKLKSEDAKDFMLLRAAGNGNLTHVWAVVSVDCRFVVHLSESGHFEVVLKQNRVYKTFKLFSPDANPSLLGLIKIWIKWLIYSKHSVYTQLESESAVALINLLMNIVGSTLDMSQTVGHRGVQLTYGVKLDPVERTFVLLFNNEVTPPHPFDGKSFGLINAYLDDALTEMRKDLL